MQNPHSKYVSKFVIFFSLIILLSQTFARVDSSVKFEYLPPISTYSDISRKITAADIVAICFMVVIWGTALYLWYNQQATAKANHKAKMDTLSKIAYEDNYAFCIIKETVRNKLITTDLRTDAQLNAKYKFILRYNSLIQAKYASTSFNSQSQSYATSPSPDNEIRQHASEKKRQLVDAAIEKYEQKLQELFPSH